MLRVNIFLTRVVRIEAVYMYVFRNGRYSQLLRLFPRPGV
jgi:hypothetical protein